MNDIQVILLKMKLQLHNGGMKASELAKEMSIPRSEINRYLYAHPNEYEKDGEYRWRIKAIAENDVVLSKLNNRENAKKYSREEFAKIADWKLGNTHTKGKAKYQYITRDKNTIECDSKSELTMLEYLETNDLIISCGGQSLCIEYDSKFRAGMSYYPDIVVLTKDMHIAIIEVKSASSMDYHKNIEKYHALAEYCKENGYEYMMVDPRDCAQGVNYLRKYAEEYLETMTEKAFLYPEIVIENVRCSIAANNFYELCILADATTEFGLNMGGVFDREWSVIREGLTQNKKEDFFRLICVAAAAFYSYHWQYYWHGLLNCEELLLKAIREYESEYGSDELAFLDPYFHSVRARDEWLYNEDRKEHEARWKAYEEEKRVREKAEQELKRWREEERRLRIERENAEQKARQLERKRIREKELEVFNRLPLSERLERILDDEKHSPDYYGVDVKSVSDEDLKTLPTELLVKILTTNTFTASKRWKGFRNRIVKELSER